jgi:hypothetical protein
VPKQDPWFFEQRALAFAKVVLTKHHDVRPLAGTDWGLDLVFEIPANGGSRRRLFGVRIVSFMDLPDTSDIDEQARSRRARNPAIIEFPICDLVIGVRKPEGMYRWDIEPVVDEGRALLSLNRDADWQPLDDGGGGSADRSSRCLV